MAIHIGNNNISKIYVGQSEVKSIWLGTTKIYSSENVLPSGYVAVDYIESYGLSYINTGITSTDNTIIELECAASDVTPSSQHSRVILSAGTSSSSMIAINLATATNEVKTMFGSSWNTSTATLDLMNKVKITLRQGSMTVEQNGTAITDTFTSASPTYGTIYLMNLFYNSALTPTGKIYGCKIYTGSTLVRDYVPCYRSTDRELGLYDFVSSSFFMNEGVGSFNAKYLDFPTGYTQVKYVDSDFQQAIDTSVKFNQNYKVVMNLLPLPNATNVTEGFFGAYDGSNNTYLGKGNAATFRIYYAHGTGSNQKYFELTEQEFYTLKALVGDRSQRFYVNTTNDVLSKNNYSNNATSYLFARHNKTSSQDEPAIKGALRLYNCDFYLSGTKTKTYAPCYRNSDNVAGVYELNGGTFLSSITGTELIKGGDM